MESIKQGNLQFMDTFITTLEFYEFEFSHGGIGIGTNNLIGSYFEILRITQITCTNFAQP